MILFEIFIFQIKKQKLVSIKKLDSGWFKISRDIYSGARKKRV